MKRHSPTEDSVNPGRLVEERLIDCFQKIIDDGSAWRMPGTSSRLAHELIEAGLCCLGPTSHRDCYGNHVPSREECEEVDDE